MAQHVVFKLDRWNYTVSFPNLVVLEDTARNAGLLLAPGLRPSAEVFFALWAKKRGYYAVLAHFWQFLVSSSNLGNF